MYAITVVVYGKEAECLLTHFRPCSSLFLCYIELVYPHMRSTKHENFRDNDRKRTNENFKGLYIYF